MFDLKFKQVFFSVLYVNVGSDTSNISTAEPGYAMPLQTVQDQISWFEEATWLGSTLFVIQYVDLYHQPRLNTLIG